MKTAQLLSAPEDCKWLRETHLAGLDLPAFASFFIEGNEDSPTRLALFTSASPGVSDVPEECFSLDLETGAYVRLSDSAENLDGFMDSADLNAHVAELLGANAGLLAGMVSPIPAEYLVYSRRKARAMDCRASGLIEEALTHEAACDSIFKTIPALWRW